MTANPEFADEVVTQALVRYVNVPGVDGDVALITLENGHDHTRPSTFGPGGLTSLNDALDAIEARSPSVRRHRGHRQAVHLRGRRRHLRHPAGHRPVAGAADRPARSPGVRPAQERLGPDVRVRERRGHGRRPGDRAALPVPHALLRCRRAGAARVLPRPGTRLGRHAVAAEPDRCRQGRHGHHRERAQPEPHAQGEAGVRARHRGRAVRAGRLHRALAAVGGRRAPRRHRGGASGDRPRPGLGRRARPWQGVRGRPGPRYRAGAVQGVGAHRAGPDRLVRGGHRGRGRDPRRPRDERGAAGGPVLVRPRAEAGQAAGRRPRPGPGATGHQGGRRRRRPDGQPARAAVRAPAPGARGDDRPRPGASGQGRRLRARRDRQAAGQAPGLPRRGEPAQGR